MGEFFPPHTSILAAGLGHGDSRYNLTYSGHSCADKATGKAPFVLAGIPEQGGWCNAARPMKISLSAMPPMTLPPDWTGYGG